MLVRFLNGTSRQIENLSGADLSGADLSGVNLSGENLSNTNLTGAKLCRAKLSRANLSRANLYGADLSNTNLYGADFSRADFSGADLSGANLYGANLRGAYMPRAKLSRADLRGADLRGAKFSYVLLMSSISWGRVSNKLCLEMMRRDALITGVEAMSRWAKGGPCPFLSTSETRAYHFYEDRSLWRKGKPQMTDRELWVALCKERDIKI